jgi:16S rRNA (cytosine967-C5)-methyltransferase
LSAPTPARRVAYEVLRRVFEHDAYADRALRSAAQRSRLEGRERAHAQRLAYGAVQRRGTCDELASSLTGRPVDRLDAPLLAALRLGLFELLFDRGAAAHAAVDQAVELAKGGRGDRRRRRGSALVNAVLRRAARERAELLAGLGHESPERAAVQFSVPTWIARLWWEERGAEQAVALMRAANEPPRRLYRPLRAPPGAAEAIARRLRASGVECELLDPALAAGAEMLAVDGGSWEAVEAAVTEGELVPQSRGSALAAALLEVRPGDRVLDLCAAPGIKTSQLAVAAGDQGEVVAVERNPARADALGQLCERLGLANVEVVVGDGRELELGSGYDRILVDAPCSGLGTLASRPDVRWRRELDQIEPLAELQGGLLGAAGGALGPGGRAVYSVCTVSRLEGEAVVAAALQADGRLRQVDLAAARPELSDDGDHSALQMLPGRDSGDGFFIAALERAR